MERLAALLMRLGKRRTIRTWVGPRPEGRTARVPVAIAARIGLVAESDDLRPITRQEAERTLAYVGFESLAYGEIGRVRPGVLTLVREGFADLSTDAVFFSNAPWGSAELQNSVALWSKLSTHTFDAGVVGFDSTIAFILWAEEED